MSMHLRGQYFIFGALCPSKSGLIHKHIVKHIVHVGTLSSTEPELDPRVYA